MKAFWDDRYSNPEFVYGELPNEFLKAHLPNFQPGSILFPAEGEGRNAVFAAQLGWQVSAFDQSSEGQKKAQQLASKNQVQIDYQVGEFSELHYEKEQFDAIALIYAHFPADVKSEYHKKLSTYLKPGGILLFEAFSKQHLAYRAANERVGGPAEPGMLFSIDEIKADFPGYDYILLTEEVVELQEGPKHSGTGSVIRFIGRKS
jgi:protein-L-isoaspartate O-methyltransferase